MQQEEENIQREAAVATEEEEEAGPHSISLLSEHGISTGDIQKLKDNGFHTIESIAFTPKKQFLTIKGISEAKAEKMILLGTRNDEFSIKISSNGICYCYPSSCKS